MQRSANEDAYTTLTFKTPVKINPGETTGFYVHTSNFGGVVLRGGFGTEATTNNWDIGDMTDTTAHIELRAGAVSSGTPFQIVRIITPLVYSIAASFDF